VDRGLLLWRAGMDYNLKYSKRDDYVNGLHVAGYAACINAVGAGLVGLMAEEDGLHIAPAPLPSEWKELRLNLVYQGGQLELELSSDMVTLNWLGAEPLRAFIYGELCPVEDRVSFGFNEAGDKP
jgi:trehalose/maltose hydrolase-like predicted phosphorylase